MSRAKVSIAVAIALCCEVGPALAQDGAGPPPPPTDIVVVAPRSAPLAGERSPYTGAPIVTTTVSIPVLYQDLDLSRPGDAERLLTRVDRVAQAACLQLDRMFPLSPDADCAARAAEPGRAAARALIAASTR